MKERGFVDIRLRLHSDSNPANSFCVYYYVCVIFTAGCLCVPFVVCVWAVGQYGKFKRLAWLPLIKIDIKLPTYQIGVISLVYSIYALISPNFRRLLSFQKFHSPFSFNVSLSVHGAR
jgi:hypothetical protein